MLRKSLAALILAGLVTPPAHAQDAAPVWDGMRVDARPPAGILWGQLMPEGDLRLQYTFGRASYGDVRFETQSVSFLDVLDLYSGSPLARTEMSHRVSLEYGFLSSLTFAVTAAWLSNSRDLANEDFLVTNESSGLSDITAGALLRVYEGNGISAHLNAAVEVPTGSIEKIGPDLTGNTRLLPYEMQMGSGSLTVVPGATAAIQNEFGTVGGQALAKLRVMDNGRDYRLGNEFHGNVWMAYHVNETVSVSTGARVRTWGSIQGEDAAMDASLEPGQDPLLSSGITVAIPASLNVRLPQGFLSGTDLLFEFVFPAYQSFDSLRQQGDWGINFTASKNFGIGDIF